jgi:hypothetical protein
VIAADQVGLEWWHNIVYSGGMAMRGCVGKIPGFVKVLGGRKSFLGVPYLGCQEEECGIVNGTGRRVGLIHIAVLFFIRQDGTLHHVVLYLWSVGGVKADVVTPVTPPVPIYQKECFSCSGFDCFARAVTVAVSV